AAYQVPLNASAAFNGFVANVSQPSQTTIGIQIAVANSISGSCNGVTYTFRGPTGTSDQFLIGSDPSVIQGTIPLLVSGTYANPGQCLKYKLTLATTDQTASPELYDITINRSP
ncbi:MAG: hypothetical protein ABIO02_01675, partial [Patescibacteria group bacterium]